MIFSEKWMRTRKLDKRLTIGLSKKEIEVLGRGLEKVLYNISEP